jgi:hypothetical protein
VIDTLAAPVVSSNSSRLLARDCHSRRLFAAAGRSGVASTPFQQAEIARLEPHHHLGLDLGQHHQALVIVRVRGEQGGPGAHLVAVLAQPGEPKLDPAQIIGIHQIAHDGGIEAEVAAGRAVGGEGADAHWSFTVARSA